MEVFSSQMFDRILNKPLFTVLKGTCTEARDIFRTLSNIYDLAFL